MLIDAALPLIGGDVLDVCTGSGVVALSVAPFARSTSAVDSSRLAVTAVRAGAIMNGRAVGAYRGDLLGPVARRSFDVILSNPPYLPTAPAVNSTIESRAWDGGPDGRRILDRLCRQAPARLRPGGVLVVVQSSLANGERTLQMLGANGMEPEVISVARGPLGPLARSQGEHLRAIGVLEGRAMTEDILVIAARRPARSATPFRRVREAMSSRPPAGPPDGRPGSRAGRAHG